MSMATLVLLDSKMFWCTFYVNNKIIIEFGFRGISRIIEASILLLHHNSRYSAQPHPIIIKYLLLNPIALCLCLN